jgi:predicted transcriptional regulator
MNNQTAAASRTTMRASLRPDPRRPLPDAARDHIRLLRQAGGTYRSIAAAAGLAPATVCDIATGRTQPASWTAAALLAVTSRSLTQARIDAGGTRLRLRALHVMGHGSARIARAVGVSEHTIRALVRGDAQSVSCRLRDAVIVVYDAWWDKRAPERTRAERAAACAARRRAIAGNWCAAAALDDDKLDIPGYRPGHGWKPATGTGVAADIRPVLRQATGLSA